MNPSSIPPQEMARMQQMNERAQKQAEEKAKIEEQKKMILAQILMPDALERLSRIKLVNSDKAERLSMSLIQAAQSGQIRGQLSEAALKSFLERMTEADGSSRLGSVAYGMHALAEESAAPRVIIGRQFELSDDDDDSSDVTMEF
eukprot:gnl/Chilomastix_cuspidata/908.p1 GENE.gnl/Chilomastix_cuspidata/908~~gnl/Chilomastix_cuspidata/908.p1  ORF type:complete len:145 (+),score=41.95 gnl/Chilomastix_cuspidata/908:41-475(+)